MSEVSPFPEWDPSNSGAHSDSRQRVKRRGSKDLLGPTELHWTAANHWLLFRDEGDATTARRNWLVCAGFLRARKAEGGEKVAEFRLRRMLAFSGSCRFFQPWLPLLPSLSHRAFAFNDSLVHPPHLHHHLHLPPACNSPTPPCLSPALLRAARHGEMAIIYLWQRIVCARGLK